jgi:hypothetical protein
LPAHEVNLANPRPIFHSRGGAAIFHDKSPGSFSSIAFIVSPARGSLSELWGDSRTKRMPFQYVGQKARRNKQAPWNALGKQMASRIAPQQVLTSCPFRRLATHIGQNHAPLRFAGIHMTETRGQHPKNVLP